MTIAVTCSKLERLGQRLAGVGCCGVLSVLLLRGTVPPCCNNVPPYIWSIWYLLYPFILEIKD